MVVEHPLKTPLVELPLKTPLVELPLTAPMLPRTLMCARLSFCFGIVLTFSCYADTPKVDTTRGDELVTEYFRLQTAVLTDRAFSEIETLDDWTSRREEYRRQLREMLGLDPLPERTPLEPVVTGTVENDDVMVERLHFQSLPGLYVTANFYRPREQQGPLPAILYVCGHGGEKKDGISLGNKTHYQHHGAWFARNGYVCLTIDTIQLGEIEGIHHGTYREKMWWWNNRGYTPAGVEAWNCMRAIDYLQSREEVDGERIGVTGRSGGGAYSWWIAALDERIKAAVPVAGITSLHNHVVDGTVEGHCDCMFMVNTYRWDYPMVAALVAPRPLLISNTDKDRIFPLDGVVDVYTKVRKIYSLYGAQDKLGLHITEGPHKDTQELRVHAFRWLNRFLRDDESLLEQPATALFEKHELKVFDALPKDERVTTIHESFVPAVALDSVPTTEDLPAASQKWMDDLREHCFRGWPEQACDLNVDVVTVVRHDGRKIRAIDYDSQLPYGLRMYVVEPEDELSDMYAINVLSQQDWETVAAGLAVASTELTSANPDEQAWREIAEQSMLAPIVYVIPRGVGPTEWSRDERTRTHIRRRFMQLGQTAATMQIYDVRRAFQALDHIEEFANRDRNVMARGGASLWTIYASLFEVRIQELTLRDLPIRNRDAPDILNVSRFVEMPHVVMMAGQRVGELNVERSSVR